MKEHEDVSLDFAIHLCTYTYSLQKNNEVSDRKKVILKLHTVF